MNRTASISSLLILAFGAASAGCSHDPAFEGAKPAVEYLAKAAADSQEFSFDSGEHQGGWAVIGGNGGAFWTKDGKAYYVNEAAKRIAPGIERAPDSVQFCDAFTKAAKSE